MRKGKGGPWQPVAIFTQDGAVKAAVGKEFVDPLSIWTWCADKPVSEADYKQALATGSWPGEIGHNSGDLSLKEEIEERASLALEWLATNGIKTKIDADMAANYRAALLELKKRAEAEHKTAKAPHLEAGRKVDGSTEAPVVRPYRMNGFAKAGRVNVTRLRDPAFVLGADTPHDLLMDCLHG